MGMTRRALLSGAAALLAAGCSPAGRTAIGGNTCSPQDIDTTVRTTPTPRWVLAVVPGSCDKEWLKRQVAAVLADASSKGVVVAVTGVDLSAATVVGLAPDAEVDKKATAARTASRCKATADLYDKIANAIDADQATKANVVGAVRNGVDQLASTAAGPITAVVVVGEGSNTDVVAFSGEALEHPHEVVNQLRAQSYILDLPAGTKFALVVTEAATTTATSRVMRDFYYAYARAWNGALVTWTGSFITLGDAELPAPVKATPAPAPPSAPTPTRDPNSNATVTTTTLASQTLFAINSTTVRPDAVKQIEDVGRSLTGAVKIEVFGYTDNLINKAISAKDLSTARANAVAAVLRPYVPRGVEMIIDGKGEADPVAPNEPATMHLNRRVTISVYRHAT